MKTPKLSLVYDRRKDGKGRLEIKVYFPDVVKQVYVPTKVYVEERYFDTDLNMVSPDVPNYKNINISIKLAMHEVKEIISEIQDENPRIIIPKDFSYLYKRKKYKEKSTDNTPDDFIKFYQSELDAAVELSPSTKTSYVATLTLLKKYKPYLTFEEMDYELALGFDRWLRGKYKNLNTIKKHMMVLKRFIHMALKLKHLEYETYNSFILFTPTSQAVNKDFLTKSEIESIIKLKYEKGTKKYDVKNMFLFAYYSALRVSDLLELDTSQFLKEGNNLFLIKTIYKLRRFNREIKINLSKVFDGKGTILIKPYLKDCEGLIFGAYTSNSTYPILKAIIKEAGITKTVSFHTARHSSLTAIAASSGNVFTVMTHGGLTNSKTAEKYIHLGEGFDDE